MEEFALRQSSIKAEFLSDFLELIGPFDKWPHGIYALLGRQHLRNQARFKLTIFLLANGVNPGIIEDYFAKCYRFDAQAWRQIKYLIKAYPAGGRWKAWNVALGKSI